MTPHTEPDDGDRGNPLEAELTEATPNHYREACLRSYDFFYHWASVVKEFRGDRAFAFDCGLLALGWTNVLGCNSQVELAHKWHCEKENVRKLVSRFQRLTGAPPLPSQRCESGKEKMKQARVKQLKAK